MINLTLELSELLLELTQRKRALRASQLISAIVEKRDAETVVLDNLEILFSQDLKLDPLKLLQGLSRYRTIVAAWPGSVDGDNLLYAVPGHVEYQRYTKPDAILIFVGDSSTKATQQQDHAAPST